MIAVPWDFDHVFGYVEVSVPEEYRSGFPFTYPAGNKVTWNPYFGTNRIFEVQYIGDASSSSSRNTIATARP
jgi:hypothetical protein